MRPYVHREFLRELMDFCYRYGVAIEPGSRFGYQPLPLQRKENGELADREFIEFKYLNHLKGSCIDTGTKQSYEVEFGLCIRPIAKR